ncbi:MAG: MmgE/PrpD family protein, partial [Burkholderiaceae bacterium]|nr:MmgE/PrpD family protein [Burkholderiaceae bacterium]
TERSGRSESFFQPTRIGDPDAPLSDRQLDDKFLELCSPTLGEARARSWLTGLWELDRHAAPFPF